MALVTVQRSPSIGNSPQSSESGAGGSTDEEESAKSSRSLSECYFAGKGAAVVVPGLGASERLVGAAPRPPPASDIQQHLQSMFYLLRPDETLKMAVKLESVHLQRTRYLVVVSCPADQRREESCLLGIDCNERTTVGLVLRVLADTTITLDGDGGFSVTVCGRHHIFKPVSVQAMWSALQTLHKVSSAAREHNYFLGGTTHDWVTYYEQHIQSDRSCLNEWHAMDSLESRRPPSPDSLRNKPCEREATLTLVRSSLKEIMMSVDLDEVTSKQVRTRLEEVLDMDLGEYKSFIDQEMLVILGQMDAATEIFPHVYLGSEWNASNLEELNKNGVCHILNVTREIDNFFPGMFDYMNVRVYDDEKTDLLKHWDDTYKYINKAQTQGSKVLVHCKMGVSRSASVVIAYAMKAYNWELKNAMEYVHHKRNCIKPNQNFISQLETYQGILDAMKNKEKLQRSKSETNLKTRECASAQALAVATAVGRSVSEGEETQGDSVTNEVGLRARLAVAGTELARQGTRPKSWSPDHATANLLFSASPGPTSASLEQLDNAESEALAGADTTDFTDSTEDGIPSTVPPPPPLPPPPCPVEARNYNLHVHRNGAAYSVTRNKILQLSSSNSPSGEAQVASVKLRVNALESLSTSQLGRNARKGLVLNLTSQFEEEKAATPPPPKTWDPGESDIVTVTAEKEPESRIQLAAGRRLRIDGDPFSNRLDRVFDREEKKVRNVPSVVTEDIMKECEVSRQSSWSSYDSAVRDCVSRQSSWGSGDTRCCTLPSRNSSWGSYDMNPGTVKRTKQKLEEGIGASDVAKRVCQDISNTTAANPAPLVDSQLTVKETNDLPETRENTIHVTRRCVSVDESKLRTVSESNSKSVPGLVQNLKKEFEAKSIALKTDKSVEGTLETKTEIRSLPSSPVSDRPEKPSPATSLEDLSVKKLVGKYEGPFFPQPQPPVPPRKSSLDPHQPFLIKSTLVHNIKKSRPPVKNSGIPSQSAVVASVVAKAASKKQQQGKTHPLARLQALTKQRHANPVYNTM